MTAVAGACCEAPQSRLDERDYRVVVLCVGLPLRLGQKRSRQRNKKGMGGPELIRAIHQAEIRAEGGEPYDR